jgi:hypothetical protein
MQTNFTRGLRVLSVDATGFLPVTAATVDAAPHLY